MKIPSFLSRILRKSGFTLVELLVVMGIIAILAAVSMSVGTMVLRQAKKTKAANSASQIQTAVLNYYTEYSVYPTPSGAAAGDLYIADNDATNWKNMIQALCGNISPSSPTGTVTPTVSNTRAISFLQLKASDVDANDAPLNPLPASSLNPYFNLVLDSDYSGLAGDSGTGQGKIPDFVNSTATSFKYLTSGTTAGVAVWANCNTGSQTLPAWYVHTF